MSVDKTHNFSTSNVNDEIPPKYLQKANKNFETENCMDNLRIFPH